MSRRRNSNETQHRVRISKGFLMGETVVTQGLWQAVMGINPSHFNACGINCPVESVSWNDSQNFIKWLNGLVSGGRFRLPTEAEWEYAARTKTTGPYAGDLDDMAWYKDSRPRPVAGKRPNAWGLYDMHGNVIEWTADWYGIYSSDFVTDPTWPASSTDCVNRRGSLFRFIKTFYNAVNPSDIERVCRGGSWYSSAKYCRSATRLGLPPDYRYRHLGLRLARTY